MDNFKEFQGKDLDEAIRQACGYFDSPREKLEIEIVQDAKSGIFGIVGARKAKIRARRAHVRDAVERVLGKKAAPGAELETANADAPPQGGQGEPACKAGAACVQEAEPEPETPLKPCQNHAGEEKSAPGNQNQVAGAARSHEAAAKPDAGERPRRKNDKRECKKREARPRNERKQQPKTRQPRMENAVAAMPQEDIDAVAEGLPARPLHELDAERLEELVAEVVSRLITPIAAREIAVRVEIGNGRVRARVDWQGDAGLLIGREGQTLAALQYLASRMVSHAMGAALRVQLDIGDYRSRQDDKLRETARFLAEKVRENGRPCSTRPLSSYHRRIIHLCLQGEPDVQTRSSGEGPLKRVLISLKRQPERA